MYIPKAFHVSDTPVLDEFIMCNSFATLVSTVDGTLLEEALAIFHGPHAYISPSWYTTSPAVPTWNYAVVHVYGVPHVVEDEEWLANLVDRLVVLYEAGMPTPWPGVLPAEFKANLLQAIVGFSMEITRVEGKFKLGQNRPLSDQLGMIRQLEVSSDPIAQALGELTRQQLGQDARDS